VRLLDGLTRAAVETKLRSCWEYQQRAELEGDAESAQAMKDTIDELLDQLLTLLPVQR
jgi:hypothetical protein